MADNYMTFNDAVEVLTPYAEKINTIKPESITWAAYQLLTSEQKAAKRYLITDYPSPTGYVNKLSDLEDVSINSQTLSNGQVPVYNSTNEVWENKTILENSLTSTATDVALTAAQGKVLQDTKQAKTLTTPLTINGTQETTVEGALSGLNDYGNALKTAISHKNIFLNPFFTVNQRGVTSGTANNVYTVDGWIADYGITAGTWALTSSGMTLSPLLNDYVFLKQKIENASELVGKTVTLSVKLSDDTIYSYTFTRQSETNQSRDFDNGTVRLNFNRLDYAGVVILRYTGDAPSSRTVKAIKLELGTVSTLANDIEPNKNVEIIKCQNPLRVVGTPNVYRGQEITLNADFWAHIADGTFENQQVGDTITLNGRKYTLAHANYWLHTGDFEVGANHWVVISPNMGNAKMNSDNSTTGGYLGSGFRSGTNHDSTPNAAFADALAIIKADFGASHILSHRAYLDNAVTGGYPSAGAWVDSEAELMSQIMAYGNRFFDPSTNLGATIPALYSIDKSQLALYAQRPDLLTDRSDWWLRDVVSAAHFACVGNSGNAAAGSASHSRGVRLAFGIIA